MKPQIYLAPMSGITDLPFRLISRELGAKLCFFQMLDSNATVHNNPAKRRILKTLKEDSPIAAQLIGSDPDVKLDELFRELSVDLMRLASAHSS